MPYIDTYSRFRTILVPEADEDYAAFQGRVVPAMMTLDPSLDNECASRQAYDAWVAYLMESATEVTLTMKRDFYSWGDVYLNGGYWDEWKITDILSATVAKADLTYSTLAKAKAAEGERFSIAKSVEDEQLVFGWANIAIDANGQYPVDWDGDVTDPGDLEKSAYEFVLKYRATGEQHQGEVKGDLVESVMFTKEKQAAMGIPDGVVPEGWWVGFHVPDAEVFAKIKSGEYEMFSVEGSAIREKLDA